MRTGIISFFYSYKKQITKQRKKFAFLQLVGKLEEYFVKEFIFHIYSLSEGNRIAFTNIGKQGEQKVDIAIISGELNGKKQITGMIEAKYLRNKHRIDEVSAEDETTTSLRSLAKQLKSYKKKRHGGYDVNLSARENDIYGLVIASFVTQEKKELFFKRQLDNQVAKKFRYHDLPKPYFRKVYDDVEVKLLDRTYYSTLRIGLWKLVHP